MPDESDESADVDGSEEPREDTDSRPLSERWNDSSDEEDSSETSQDTDADEEPDEADADERRDDTDDGDGASDGSEDDETDSDADSDSTQTTDDEEGETDGDSDTEDSDDADTGAGPDDSDTETRTAQTDGEGYVHDRPDEEDDPEYPDPDDDIGGISTPPDDEEMPLADHIEEMVIRLAVVILIGSAATTIGLLWASEAIALIWDHVLPQALLEQDVRPHVYHPLELWLTRIKVAALLGVLIALPMLVYQVYLFMRPGLYPNERKYYLSAVPVSLVLALVGMFVSFRFVLPILFQYFTYYADGSAEIHYALGDTFNLVITLTAFLAVVFQIPLFIILAVMMGITTREWLADKRLYFWAAFFGLSFIATFDPTMMAAIIVALIMIALFEGTLLLLKWVGR